MSEPTPPNRAHQPHQDSHPGIATGNPLNAGGDAESRQEEVERREGDDAGEPEAEQDPTPDGPPGPGNGGA